MSHIRIGNAPCSWGVLEFDLDGEAAGYGQVLDEMAAAGYEGTSWATGASCRPSPMCWRANWRGEG